MEILLIVTVIFGVLLAFDFAALRWGVDQRQNDWLAGSYDPRNDWNVSHPTTPPSQKPSLSSVYWTDADAGITFSQN